MPINIDAQRKKKLQAGIQPAIEAATVQGRQFLNSDLGAALDDINVLLPQSGPIRDRLRSYIGEEPMYDFVYGQLAQELSNQTFKINDKRRLVEIEGFEDSAAVASRLVDILDALPNRYVLSMRLPTAMNAIFLNGETSVEVAAGVVLRKGKAMVGVYPAAEREPGLLGALLGAVDWDADAAYLQVEFDGFVGRYVTAESHAEAVEVMYAFVGASIAFRALKFQQGWSAAVTRWNISVHQLSGEEWLHVNTEDIDSSRGNLLKCLVVHDQEKKLKPEHETLWLRDCVRRIGVLLSAPAKSRSRLLLGCKWLFDSYCGNDQLLQYIQATVVVETLLGDKAASDQVGLGALLGNRCAYLIGHTSTQRDELLDEFKRIYDVRSKIVHRGKSRLTRKESMLFSRLNWICGRIIQVETDLLQRDKEK